MFENTIVFEIWVIRYGQYFTLECMGFTIPGIELSNFRGTAILASRFLPKIWHQGNCQKTPRPYQVHRICLCSLFDYQINII